MKRFILFVLIGFCVALSAVAKGGQDFASRFLSLYAKDYTLTCKTISPQMMMRILQDESTQKDTRLLSQIRSIRFITHESNAEKAAMLFGKAEQLAQKNSQRYQPYSVTDQHNIYIRRRGRQILEIVVIQNKDNHTFSMINLTGLMSNDFLQQLQRL